MPGVRTLAQQTARPALAQTIDDFVKPAAYPCVGAKSALVKGRLNTAEGGDFLDLTTSSSILCTIARFLTARPAEPGLHSLAIQFDAMEPLPEDCFEQVLWARLQALTDADAASGAAYDPLVSSNPNHAGFAVSLCETAFFIIGLHPGASRPARRFSRPAIILNPHTQFEQLKSDGKYERMQDCIRQRDLAFSGSLNPMLARHGEISAARQYSGRAVTADWQCPFSDKRDQTAAGDTK